MDVPKKIKLKAVGNDDLDDYLNSLGLLQPLQLGQVKCAVCGKRVTKNTFSCIFPHDGEICLCCNDLACYEKVVLNQGSSRNEL